MRRVGENGIQYALIPLTAAIYYCRVYYVAPYALVCRRSVGIGNMQVELNKTEKKHKNVLLRVTCRAV